MYTRHDISVKAYVTVGLEYGDKNQADDGRRLEVGAVDLSGGDRNG